MESNAKEAVESPRESGGDASDGSESDQVLLRVRPRAEQVVEEPVHDELSDQYSSESEDETGAQVAEEPAEPRRSSRRNKGRHTNPFNVPRSVLHVDTMHGDLESAGLVNEVLFTIVAYCVMAWILNGVLF